MELNALQQLVTEIELLLSLAHDEEHSNHVLCTVLWSSVVGLDWNLHAQSKQGNDGDYPKVVEAFSGYLHKHEAHSLSKH